MKYTVKQFSTISGVSNRTLRFYHQIGLLEPATIGKNSYRYYDESQLLILQQILFFRELGFQLKDIQQIMMNNDFDQISALEKHKIALTNNIARTQKLVTTIEKTIAYLQGKSKITDEEIYYGFDKNIQLKYDEYLIDKHGVQGKLNIEESKRRTQDWQKQDFIDIKKQHDQLYQQFDAAITKGLAPESNTVQELVTKHHELVKIFYTPTKDVYEKLGDTYCEHPDFRKYFDSFNSKLAEYLARAIKIYAAQHFN